MSRANESNRLPRSVRNRIDRTARRRSVGASRNPGRYQATTSSPRRWAASRIDSTPSRVHERTVPVEVGGLQVDRSDAVGGHGVHRVHGVLPDRGVVDVDPRPEAFVRRRRSRRIRAGRHTLRGGATQRVDHLGGPNRRPRASPRTPRDRRGRAARARAQISTASTFPLHEPSRTLARTCTNRAQVDRERSDTSKGSVCDKTSLRSGVPDRDGVPLGWRPRRG